MIKTAPIAKELGDQRVVLRDWLARADVEEGRKEDLTSDERKELVVLHWDKPRLETENEILGRPSVLFARVGILTMLHPVVAELSEEELAVAAC